MKTTKRKETAIKNIRIYPSTLKLLQKLAASNHLTIASTVHMLAVKK